MTHPFRPENVAITGGADGNDPAARAALVARGSHLVLGLADGQSAARMPRPRKGSGVHLIPGLGLPTVLAGVLAGACASMATGASGPVGALGAVTVTVTPTILVSPDSNGNPVTVGTVFPTQTVSSGSGSMNLLLWSVIGLLAMLVAGIVGWWLAGRKKPSGESPALAQRRSTDGATAAAREVTEPKDEPIEGSRVEPAEEQDGRHQR